MSAAVAFKCKKWALQFVSFEGKTCSVPGLYCASSGSKRSLEICVLGNRVRGGETWAEACRCALRYIAAVDLSSRLGFVGMSSFRKMQA